MEGQGSTFCRGEWEAFRVLFLLGCKLKLLGRRLLRCRIFSGSGS